MQNVEVSDFKNIKLFKGLDALRFFAAFLVLMNHSETIRKKNGLGNFEWLGLFRNGGNAVVFFFVLSGFLITYLLLKELHTNKTISVKKFYLKRVLRIWPLYFLLVFIGVVFLPYIFSFLKVNYEMPYTIEQSWFYFLFFLPGLITFYFGHHFLEPLWSIGVEEVFYLIWAPLFKIRQKKILELLIGVIIVKTVLHLIDIYFIDNKLYSYLLNTFQFEAMAIGGLGAYFIFTHGNKLTQNIIFKTHWQIIIFSILIIYLTFHTNFNNTFWNILFTTPVLSSFIIDFLFLYTIICVSLIENSVIKLNYRTLSFLGGISYGIYMYHMLAIFTIIFFLKEKLSAMNLFMNSFVFYISVTILTVIIATLSKYLFENYFLKLKGQLDNKFPNK